MDVSVIGDHTGLISQKTAEKPKLELRLLDSPHLDSLVQAPHGLQMNYAALMQAIRPRDVGWEGRMPSSHTPIIEHRMIPRTELIHETPNFHVCHVANTRIGIRRRCARQLWYTIPQQWHSLIVCKWTSARTEYAPCKGEHTLERV
jgi:hypothetical protein